MKDNELFNDLKPIKPNLIGVIKIFCKHLLGYIIISTPFIVSIFVVDAFHPLLGYLFSGLVYLGMAWDTINKKSILEHEAFDEIRLMYEVEPNLVEVVFIFVVLGICVVWPIWFPITCYNMITGSHFRK